jgi:protein-S-isoprenylcysteine O-methyltransferase Ste14
MKTIFRHGSSFIAPIVMCLVLPALIIWYGHRTDARSWINPSPALLILGLLITAAGFILLVSTIRMFILIGRGTIMPWDPTRKLIVAGLYQHVRNPMILSILILQIGEALLFSSWGMGILAALFFVINTVYFIASEEPGLEKRFGKEYVEYKKNVPRWIPRIKPWRPGNS